MASTTNESAYSVAKQGFGTGTNELYDRYAIISSIFDIRTWIDVVRVLVHVRLTRRMVYRTSGKQSEEVHL